MSQHLIPGAESIKSLSNAVVSALRASNVVYVDRRIVIVNKPAGLVTQKDLKNRSSAFDALLHEVQEKLEQQGPLFPVHRLDKGTTGALILARSQNMARELSQQMQTRTIKKTYLALVESRSNPLPMNEGTISLPLLNQDGRMSVNPQGKLATTCYQVLASSTKHPYSLVRLDLITGLKHQLRVHMAHSHGLNAPILGDIFYSQKQAYHPAHLFLHASEISMRRYQTTRPAKQFTLGIKVPLPEAFVAKCEELHMPLHQDNLTGGVFRDGINIEGDSVRTLGREWMGT